MSAEQQYLSTSEAALRLGVSAPSIVRWAEQGRLACWRTPGGHRRFKVGDVDALAGTLKSERENS